MVLLPVSVIIDQFHFENMTVFPDKAEPPIPGPLKAMLVFSFAFQRLQISSRNSGQIIKTPTGVHQFQLISNPLLELLRTF
jgi:hypothetical protein